MFDQVLWTMSPPRQLLSDTPDINVVMRLVSARRRAVCLLLGGATLLLSALLAALSGAASAGIWGGSGTSTPSAVPTTASCDYEEQRGREEVPVRERLAAGTDDPADQTVISGRCVLAGTDVPLAGVSVRYIGYPRANDGRPWNESIVRTDSDGRFRIAVAEPEDIHEVLIGDSTYCQRRAWFKALDRGEERDLGLIGMEPGVEVRGMLLDDVGLPVAGVNLLAPSPGIGLQDEHELAPFVVAETATDGSFSFGALPQGEYELSLLSAGHLELVSGSLITVPAIGAGPVVATVVVRRLPQLQVRVTDARGHAIPRAVVRTWWQRGARAELGSVRYTDGEGRTALEALGHQDAFSRHVSAWASGYPVTNEPAPGIGAGAMQIVLREGRARSLRVRDAVTGQPVQMFAVTHGPRTAVFPPKLVQSTLEVRDRDGRCRFHGIGGDHRVRVRAEGYEAREVELREADASDEEVVVDLHRTAELEVVARGSGGDATGALQVVRTTGRTSALSPSARLLATGELVAGRALIRGIPAGRCWVRPAGAWCAPFAHGPLELRSGERRKLYLEPASGCTVYATLVPPEAGSLVRRGRLVRADGTMRLPLDGMAGFPLDADGRLRCAGVPSGEWHVEVASVVESWTGVAPHGRPRPLEAWTRVAILMVPGAVELECQLDCSGVLPGRIRGRVLGMTGSSDRSRLQPIGRRGSARWLEEAVVVDEDGAFVAGLPPGDYQWMLVREEGRNAGGAVLLDETVEVRAGAEVTATLRMPTVEQVELLIAAEMRRGLRGPVSVRYQAATELVAGQYVVGPAGIVRIEIAAGAKFTAEAPPYGMLSLNRLACGPPARYAVGRR